MKYLCLTLALFLGLLARGQDGIPGTQTLSAPAAPPATNSPFGATDSRYNMGGFGTWAEDVSQLRDLNWLPQGWKRKGMTHPIGTNLYQLAEDLTTWVLLQPFAPTPKTVATIAQLQSASPQYLSANYFGTNANFTATVNVQGYYQIGDGGGGVFMFRGGSNYVADGGYVHNVAGGQMVRDFGIPANPLWWGAKADYDPDTGAGTDNTAAFVNMINSPYVMGTVTANLSRSFNKSILIPKGYYKLESLLLYSTNAALSSVPIEARGTFRIEGENMGSTKLYFNSTNANALTIGNQRVTLSQLTIASTTARKGAANSGVSTNGNGLFIYQPSPGGSGVGIKVIDVTISGHPGNGFYYSSQLEQGFFRNIETSVNQRWGFLLEPYPGQPLGGYESLFMLCRSIGDMMGAWSLRDTSDSTFMNCEAISFGGNEGIRMNGAVNCVWDNPDVECDVGSLVPASLTPPTRTDIIFGTTNIYCPSGNFVAAGFYTNRTFLLITNSLNNDGTYPIYSFDSTNINILSSYGQFTSGADASNIGLVCSPNGVGMLLVGGFGAQIRGGLFGNLSGGIMIGQGGNHIEHPRFNNYAAANPRIPYAIQMVSVGSFISGNTINLGAGAWPRVNKAIGGRFFSSATNIVTVGNSFLSPINFTTGTGSTINTTTGTFGNLTTGTAAITGQLDIGNGTGNDIPTVSAGSGGYAAFDLFAGPSSDSTKRRFRYGMDNSSNFFIQAYDDFGVAGPIPFSYGRTSKNMALNGMFTLNSTAGTATISSGAAGFVVGTAGPCLVSGTGDPNSVYARPQGTLFLRTDGTAGTSVYVKSDNSSSTGWRGLGTLKGTASYTPPSLAAGATTQTTVTVTGALVGDGPSVGLTSLGAQLVLIQGSVNANNTVTVTLYNPTAGTISLGAGTLNVFVNRQ